MFRCSAEPSVRAGKEVGMIVFLLLVNLVLIAMLVQAKAKVRELQKVIDHLGITGIIDPETGFFWVGEK